MPEPIVTTYPEMNEQIVGILRLSLTKPDQYAAQYIEELRVELEQARADARHLAAVIVAMRSGNSESIQDIVSDWLDEQFSARIEQRRENGQCPICGDDEYHVDCNCELAEAENDNAHLKSKLARADRLIDTLANWLCLEWGVEDVLRGWHEEARAWARAWKAAAKNQRKDVSDLDDWTEGLQEMIELLLAENRQLEAEAERLKATSGLLITQRADLEKLNLELGAENERLRAPLPCGHPAAAVVSSDEGTQYCGWCAAIDAEREACAAQVAHMTCIGPYQKEGSDLSYFSTVPSEALDALADAIRNRKGA